jgi:hypothetical protein
MKDLKIILKSFTLMILAMFVMVILKPFYPKLFNDFFVGFITACVFYEAKIYLSKK